MGTGWFLGPLEDDVAMLIVDKYVVLVNDGHAVCITQFPQTDEIVGETRHDVACLGM